MTKRPAPKRELVDACPADLPSPPRTLLLPAVAAAATTAATATTAAASTTATATAATATTVVAAPAAESTTATATTGLPLVGFVHADGAAVELGAIHLCRRGSRRCVVSERNEPESTGPTGLAVCDDLGIVELAEALEGSTETFVVRTPAEATYEQSLGHLSL